MGPIADPHRVGVGDEIAHLKARLVAAEEERDAALRSNSSTRQATPNQRGSHTDKQKPSHALFGASRIESVVARQSDLQETLELGGPPDLVLKLTSMLSDGEVRMTEMNGEMVP